MSKKNIIPLAVYFVFVLIHLIGEYIGDQDITSFSKPVLMPLLLVFAYSFEWNDQQLKIRVTLALLFSWLGDILLMFQGRDEVFFMAGLGAFLMGHIFYIISNRRSRTKVPYQGVYDISWILSIVVILYAGIMFYNLQPQLGDMLIPVLLYTIVISMMGVSSAYRWLRTNFVSFWLVMAGASLFILSDSLIAINKFLSPLGNARILIMLTYTVAQFLLVFGFVKHKELNKR